MAKRKNVLLKLGGSIVTYKGSTNFPLSPKGIWDNATRFMNTEVVRRICQEIKTCLPNLGYLIVVHGAGIFGHFPVSSFLEVDPLEQRLVGWPLTLYSVQLENTIFMNEMLSSGIPAVSIPPHSLFTVTSRDTERPWVGIDALFDCPRLERLVEHYTPVLFGDIVFDQNGDASVLSGDTILYLCARELKDVDLVIAGTDVQGIFTDDPKKNSRAKLVETITLSEKDKFSPRESSSLDVDGGMGRKFKELMSIARLGIPSMVINALQEGNILKALRGEKVGTSILP
ncbi:MAG: isopentenyl phosphate kinase [Candidatus Atabeyarchaeum deiterrae]